MTEDNKQAEDVAAKLMGKVVCTYCSGKGRKWFSRAPCPVCKGTRWIDRKAIPVYPAYVTNSSGPR